MSVPSSSSVPATSATEAPAGVLRSGALDLRHAIVISVAVMSPAASVFFNTVPQAQLVGAAIPLCFVVGFVVALLVANQYSEFSREIPSSGSAYTFVTEGLGARWGFLTGWIGLLAVAIGVPYSFVFMSYNVQTLMARWFGINIHWSVYFVAATGIVFALAYSGIRQSMRIDLGFVVFELGICVLLAVLVLFRVGTTTGLSAAPFSVSSVPPTGNLAGGIIFAVLSFIGFETAAVLGEETRSPHRNIPRAVYGSLIVVGLFFLLMVYAATMGYGPAHMATGYGNDPAPFDTISRRFGGPVFAALIDIVGVLGFFSAALAIVNGGARILYAVGRDGLLPRWTAWTHPTRQTPGKSIALLCGFGLVCGLPLGVAFTPIDAYGFLGTLDAFLILLIYALVSVSCILFFRRKRREHFSLLRHGILPGVAGLLALGIFVAAVTAPNLAPLSYVPFVLGVWLIAGVCVLVAMRGKIDSAPAAR